ncbi:MAG: ATP-dependent sacrificial sulfur transferase LarE [Chloroflexota bacterium]|nr:ATP-dependent sacrificial sulfur transferase LarE [Chloroflexota bacterium]MDE2918634.1 ATP-dependent sacrificial sulfur transferase LarE [Chloroflexota bacterium]
MATAVYQPSIDLEAPLEAKTQFLQRTLGGLENAVVAYSGGVDSTFLAKMAYDALGSHALAVTAVSPSLSQAERDDAARFAAQIGIRHEFIQTRELENSAYRANDSSRCFHCKAELFDRLREFVGERGVQHMLYGPVVDDLGDFRPGMAASRARGARAPLVEAGLRKAEVRELSRRLGLPSWDKPAVACLSSRVAYGSEVTVEKLGQIEAGEALLRAEGFRELRVRHHGSIARIEVPETELARFTQDSERRQRIIQGLKSLGFTYVTLDLQGFRSGAMNEALPVISTDE